MADTVLDDALADFDIPADRLQAAALADKLQDASISEFQKDASKEGSQGHAAASSSAAPVLNGASSAAQDSASASKPFDPLPERKEKSTSVSQTGSFDPLGKGNLKKKAKAKNPPASRKPDNASEASSSSSGSRTQPPGKQPASQTPPPSSAKDNKEVDKELAQGMAQLMADLAKVWQLEPSCASAGMQLHIHTQAPHNPVLQSAYMIMAFPSGSSMPSICS